MSLPLEGIRVIDWTIWQQGPVAAAMLGDLGADVIKIEERVSGDPGRGLIAMAGLNLASRPDFYVEANNRNKRGMTLDLKKTEAREIIYALVARSDVFVQNFRKGVAERIGVGYEALKAHNPRLIYASATGYGSSGPDSGDPSFDYLGLARSGIMLAAGEPGMPPLAIAGGIVLGLGYILGGLLGGTNPILLILFIGVIGGSGIGLAYVVPIAVGMRWFPDKKGLITGLAVAGFGFGAMLWVKLAGEWGYTIANMSASRMMRYSSPSIVTSVPEYFP